MLSTEEIKHLIDIGYHGLLNWPTEHGGYNETLEHELEVSIDNESFQVMLSSNEFWEPNHSGIMDMDYEVERELSSTSSMLRTYNNTCQDYSPTTSSPKETQTSGTKIILVIGTQNMDGEYQIMHCKTHNQLRIRFSLEKPSDYQLLKIRYSLRTCLW